MTSTQSDKLHLFDHPVSSYAQKARITLRVKGLDFTKTTPKDLGAGFADAEFSAANPRMEVPALIVTDAKNPEDTYSVFDSTAIMMLLEDAYPQHKSILAPSARARAEARMIEEVCDGPYEAINWAVGEIRWFRRAEGDHAVTLIAKAEDQTKAIQSWLSEKLGDKLFFAGDEISYADIAAAPVVNRSVFYGFGPTPGSPLQKWHERISEIASFKQTFGEMHQAASALSKVGSDIWKPHAGRRRQYRDYRLEWMIKNGALEIVEKGLKDDNIRFGWP